MGRPVRALRVKRVFQPKEVTKILSSLGRQKDWPEALWLFNKLLDTRCAAQKGDHLNVYHLNATIDACQRGLQWQLALRLFETVPQVARIVPDVVSYNVTLSSCEKAGQWPLVLWLLDAMSKTVRPDPISYSTAISSCEMSGRWQMALFLFHRMSILNLSQDSVSYSVAISSCAKGAQWKLALKLFSDCPDADVVAYNSALSASQRVTHWQAVLRFFHGLQSSHLSPSPASFSIAISSFEKAALWHLAVDLLQQHLSSTNGHARSEPTSAIIFNAAISACAGAARWELAVDLLGTLPSAKLAADP